MDDYDSATPAPAMVDLVTVGLSSNSFQSYFKSVVDSNPAFTAAKPLVYMTDGSGAMVNTFNTTLSSFNPWLKYVDSNVQGYAVVTLTASKLSCSFHKLKAIANGAAPAMPATASVPVVDVAAGTPAVTLPASRFHISARAAPLASLGGQGSPVIEPSIEPAKSRLVR